MGWCPGIILLDELYQSAMGDITNWRTARYTQANMSACTWLLASFQKSISAPELGNVMHARALFCRFAGCWNAFMCGVDKKQVSKYSIGQIKEKRNDRSNVAGKWAVDHVHRCLLSSLPSFLFKTWRPWIIAARIPNIISHFQVNGHNVIASKWTCVAIMVALGPMSWCNTGATGEFAIFVMTNTITARKSNSCPFHFECETNRVLLANKTW